MTKSSKNKLNIKERIDGEKMDLSLSDLTQLPAKEIAAFKRANNVDLSNNRITSIGPNIALLSHLVVLDLSRNLIAKLPAEIGQLINLRHLDLYNNRLDHLPLEMGRLTKLRYLDVKNNPLKSGILYVVGMCGSDQECRTAAKKVVPFLANMALQIQEECEQRRQEKKLKAKEKYAAIQQTVPPKGPNLFDLDESASDVTVNNGGGKRRNGAGAKAKRSETSDDDEADEDDDDAGSDTEATEDEDMRKCARSLGKLSQRKWSIRRSRCQTISVGVFMVFSTVLPYVLLRYRDDIRDFTTYVGQYWN